MSVVDVANWLVCPESKMQLRACSLAEAERQLGGTLHPRRASYTDGPQVRTPFGVTDPVLLRVDSACAFPVVEGIPILLAPEMLGAEDASLKFDLTDRRYAEAYEEMTYYDDVASQQARDVESSESFEIIRPVLEAGSEARKSFPEPRTVWLDAVYDCAAQWDAYHHISPIHGKSILQLGGKGTHAIKFLLGGADSAWLVTPMLGEAQVTRDLARAANVDDRLHCVVAIAEQMPFARDSFDAVYSGGCIHHSVTSLALPEIARILRVGGRFGSLDPWQAPLYSVGIKVFGKREPDVHCRPLTRKRVEPIRKAFHDYRVIQHGTLTRYPLLALGKLGIQSKLSTVWRFNALDDAICSFFPGMRKMGSSVALIGTK